MRYTTEGKCLVSKHSCHELFHKDITDAEMYISVWISLGDHDEIVMENYKFNNLNDIRFIIWISKGDVIKTKLAPEPKTWRFAHGSGTQTNYPPPYVCNNCHRNDRC